MSDFLKSSFFKLLILIIIVTFINFYYLKFNQIFYPQPTSEYILVNIQGPFSQEGKVKINLTNHLEKIVKNFLIKNNYKLKSEYRKYILSSKDIVNNTINFYPFFQYQKNNYYRLFKNKGKRNGRKARYYK